MDHVCVHPPRPSSSSTSTVKIKPKPRDASIRNCILQVLWRCVCLLSLSAEERQALGDQISRGQNQRNYPSGQFALAKASPYTSHGRGNTLFHTLTYTWGTEAQLRHVLRPRAMSSAPRFSTVRSEGTYPVHNEDLAGLALFLQLPAGDGHGVEEAEAPGKREVVLDPSIHNFCPASCRQPLSLSPAPKA